jgi:ABC-2 type transport system permease protein
MYMMISSFFMAAIIMLEAGPVYMIFVAGMKNRPLSFLQWLFIIPCFCMVLGIVGFVIYQSMQKGLRALEKIE